MSGDSETMAETRDTFCRICESLCGLKVEVEAGRVTHIRTNADHVGTGGFGCLKGLNQHKLYDSPDRLEYPEKRIGDHWERISWEQALAEIGAKVKAGPSVAARTSAPCRAERRADPAPPGWRSRRILRPL